MLEVIKWIWQLPQHIVAILYCWYLSDNSIIKSRTKEKDWILYRKGTAGCVTFGRYIFASVRASDTTVKHETGHVKQSLILGPLYLIVIGLPSIIWASTHKRLAPKKSYYWFFTERWANKLAGLDDSL